MTMSLAFRPIFWAKKRCTPQREKGSAVVEHATQGRMNAGKLKMHLAGAVTVLASWEQLQARLRRWRHAESAAHLDHGPNHHVR